MHYILFIYFVACKPWYVTMTNITRIYAAAISIAPTSMEDIQPTETAGPQQGDICMKSNPSETACTLNKSPKTEEVKVDFEAADFTL